MSNVVRCPPAISRKKLASLKLAERDYRLSRRRLLGEKRISFSLPRARAQPFRNVILEENYACRHAEFQRLFNFP